MYKKFLELFGRENLLEQALVTTITMLESDLEMFLASVDSLRRKDDATLPFDIYEKDKEINRYEHDVRRKVLTHLTIAGTHNIVPGLALVSIVIDVERIGDYTKNITELAQAHPTRLNPGQVEADLAFVEQVTQERFDRIIQILKDSDFDMARQVMHDHREISSRCDTVLNDIISGKFEDLSNADAVVLALYFRYLKRIAAHLTNIASSIVNPFPKIGFKYENGDH